MALLKDIDKATYATNVKLQQAKVDARHGVLYDAAPVEPAQTKAKASTKKTSE